MAPAITMGPFQYGSQQGTQFGNWGQQQQQAGGSTSSYFSPYTGPFYQNLTGGLQSQYGNVGAGLSQMWNTLAGGYNPDQTEAAQQAYQDAQAKYNKLEKGLGQAPNLANMLNADPWQYEQVMNQYGQAQAAYNQRAAKVQQAYKTEQADQQALQNSQAGAGMTAFGGQGGILGGYQGLFNNAMGLTNLFGATQAQQIQNAYQQQLAQQQQGLLNRGLGNTTVQNSVDTGLLQNEQLNMTNLAQQVNQQQLGVLGSFGNNYLGAAMGMGEQAIGQQLGLNQANLGTQAQLGGENLGILSRYGTQNNGYFGNSMGSGYNFGGSSGTSLGSGPMGNRMANGGGYPGMGPDNMYQGSPAYQALQAQMYSNPNSPYGSLGAYGGGYGTLGQGVAAGTVSYNPQQMGYGMMPGVAGPPAPGYDSLSTVGGDFGGGDYATAGGDF